LDRSALPGDTLRTFTSTCCAPLAHGVAADSEDVIAVCALHTGATSVNTIEFLIHAGLHFAFIAFIARFALSVGKVGTLLGNVGTFITGIARCAFGVLILRWVAGNGLVGTLTANGTGLALVIEVA
jgi:hypothetical protein